MDIVEEEGKDKEGERRRALPEGDVVSSLEERMAESRVGKESSPKITC